MSGKLQKIEYFADYQMNAWLTFFEKTLNDYPWIARIVLSYDDAGAGAEPEYYSMSGREDAMKHGMQFVDGDALYSCDAIQSLKMKVDELMKQSNRVEKEWNIRFEFFRENKDKSLMFVLFTHTGKHVARYVGNYQYIHNPNPPSPICISPPPLKRSALEVLPYVEAVKKVKVAPVVALETVMKANKSVADIVKELSTKLENDDDLRKAIEKVNDTKASKNYRTGYSFAKSSADCSFYFLWLMLKAGYPASYEFNTLGKFRVAVAVGKEEESILSGMTQRDPGFYEESIGGVAYCNGQPRPPLRRVYENELSLFFPSDIKESTRNEYLGYIRDFIVYHFPKSS